MKTTVHEEIGKHAYALWQASGGGPGRDLDHWLRAEREIIARTATGGEKAASRKRRAPARKPGAEAKTSRTAKKN